MNLSAPKFITWLIAVIIGMIGIIFYLGVIVSTLAVYAFWIEVVAFGLLVVGTAFKDI